MAYLITSELTSYTTILSNTIYKNMIPVTKATLSIVTTSDISNFTLGLTNVTSVLGVKNIMEEVSNGEEYTFIDPTGQDVRYQIWGNPGKVISKIIVKIN